MSDYPLSNRFRVFREHKYIIHLFMDLMNNLSTMDFNDNQAVNALQRSLQSLAEMVYAHADYEEHRLLKPLVDADSALMQAIFDEHQQHDGQFEGLFAQLDAILAETETDKRFELGYRLYLDFRKIFAMMLMHLDYEERTIMPALQQLLTDEQIKSVEHDTYARMTSDQMVGMMHALIPHFNPDDRRVFILDMAKAQQEKFQSAWPKMQTALPEEEVAEIEKALA